MSLYTHKWTDVLMERIRKNVNSRLMHDFKASFNNKLFSNRLKKTDNYVQQNWMMKFKQVERGEFTKNNVAEITPRMVRPTSLMHIYLVNVETNEYAETIKSPSFHWKILHHGLKRETSISLVSSQA